jgi:pyruvate dehydrogenase kinase 2/3/4
MPGDVVSAAAYDVERLARETYGASPAIAVVGDLDASLTYVRTHMREAVGELLKNAVRATLEKHGDGSPLPDVRVVVASGASEITIKVGDEGGGCPRSTRHDMWSWFWSSAAAPARRPLDDGRAVARAYGATLSGMGIGLPMTRCLARYFGGELALRPLEGHGTDAYLHLTVLGDEQCEHLPPAARLSPGELDSTMSEAYAYFDERVR